jgi:hypothetical protein
MSCLSSRKLKVFIDVWKCLDQFRPRFYFWEFSSEDRFTDLISVHMLNKQATKKQQIRLKKT